MAAPLRFCAVEWLPLLSSTGMSNVWPAEPHHLAHWAPDKPGNLGAGLAGDKACHRTWCPGWHSWQKHEASLAHGCLLHSHLGCSLCHLPMRIWLVRNPVVWIHPGVWAGLTPCSSSCAPCIAYLVDTRTLRSLFSLFSPSKRQHHLSCKDSVFTFLNPTALHARSDLPNSPHSIIATT